MMSPIKLSRPNLLFLLRLLGCEGYRARLSQIEINKATKAEEKQKIANDLQKQGLIDCQREPEKIKILDAGKGMLKLGAEKLSELPITEQDLQILKAAKSKQITVDQLNLAELERQKVTSQLAERELIQIVPSQIKEVNLTETGKSFLREDYLPSSPSATLSLGLLKNYLIFLRGSSLSVADQHLNHDGHKPSDEEVLQTIRRLDQQHGGENYLPLYHLRQALQPLLEREELDQILYRLQGSDRLTLSSVVETAAFSSEQLEAGIPQPLGGPLFFIELE